MKSTLEEIAEKSPEFKAGFDTLKYRLSHDESLEGLCKIDREILKIYLAEMTSVFEKSEVWEKSEASKYLFSYVMARASIDEINLYIKILAQDRADQKKGSEECDICDKRLSALRAEIDDYAKSLGNLFQQAKSEVDRKEGKGNGNRDNLQAYDEIINSIYDFEIKPIYTSQRVTELYDRAREIKAGKSNVLSQEDLTVLEFAKDTETLVTGCREALTKANSHKGIDFFKSEEREESASDQLYEAKSGLQHIFKGENGINEATIAEKYNGSAETELKSFERRTVERLFVMSKFLMYALREKYNEEFRQINLPY